MTEAILPLSIANPGAIRETLSATHTETPIKTRRGRKKSIGSLVLTSRGQEFVVGYDNIGTVVTLTRPEAEAFARQFHVVKKSLRVRFVTRLYNKYAMK